MKLPKNWDNMTNQERFEWELDHSPTYDDEEEISDEEWWRIQREQDEEEWQAENRRRIYGHYGR